MVKSVAGDRPAADYPGWKIADLYRQKPRGEPNHIVTS